MKTFIILFHVWINNELSIAKTEILASSKKEAEELFLKEKHIFPVDVREKC